MTNAATDRFLTMTQAAKAIRHLPRRFSPATVWRWARYGLKTPSGRVVCLRQIRLGGGLYTTAKWLDEFFLAVMAEDQTGWRRGPQRRAVRRGGPRQRGVCAHA